MIIKNYRSNEVLRKSFNKLAEKTFGLNFENWYQRGYWGEQYNPYSMVIENEIVANVSVNRTDFLWNGKCRHFIQLGTVMTEENHRGQGYIRQIMKEIEKDYAQDCEGMYLFANDSVLTFYPKFGFRIAKEYQYTKTVDIAEQQSAEQIIMQKQEDWQRLKNAIECSDAYSRFELTGNSGLILFYITGGMQESVYYIQKYDTYVIAEIEGSVLLIHNIFSPKKIPLDNVIAAFGQEIKQVTLGFTPMEAQGYSVCEHKEEDCTLFVKGSGFTQFEQERLMVPMLAHA